MPCHKTLASAAAVSMLGAALLFSGCASEPVLQTQQFPAGQPAPGQEMFATDQEASDALVAAAKGRDHDALARIFGPASKELMSGDKVEDENAFNKFVQNATEHSQLEKMDDNTYMLDIGKDNWPFPIPIVKTTAGQWFFDTEAGKHEILARRIGANELETIKVCRAYLEAQREYASQDRDDSGVLKYAQHIVSHNGHDGLYWTTGGGEPASPFGELLAEASLQGYTPGQGKGPHPYDGYVYHILTRQGPDAPGGKYNYVINGNMIAGFALVACPAEYGSSGVMTFIISHQGKLYQKDLGPDTTHIVRNMKEYDPGAGWTLVSP